MSDVTPNFKTPKRARRVTASTLKARATRLHSQYVRLRDGRCVRCGTTSGQLQCMHVFSRRYTATRTHVLNGHTGCAACHRWLTENPYEHVTFFRRYLGDDTFFMLRDLAYAGVGTVTKAEFWQQECDRLNSLIRGLK